MNTRKMINELKEQGFTTKMFSILFNADMSDTKEWIQNDEVPESKWEILRRRHEKHCKA